MDAIKSVENEVDKVLRLFSDCRDSCTNKLDQSTELLEKLKRDLEAMKSDKDDTPSSQQINIIQKTCDTIQDLCAKIINSHRELHVPVSKIGKSIDKNFCADFACASDSSLFQSQEHIDSLNLAIVQHFLRNGMADIADEFVRESGMSLDKKEQLKFVEIDEILTSLRKHDVAPVLKWAIKNRKRLKEIESPLEFKIHRINIIDLYKQGIDKQHEIIQYARENLQHLDPAYNLEIQHLMGGIIYLKTGIANSPYKSFLDPINYSEVEDIFTRNACRLMNMSFRSPISVVVDAGAIALPALLNINQILSHQGVQNVWQLRDELPVEIDLGRQLQFHSTFSCPILKQQSSEANPPMRLYLKEMAATKISKIKIGPSILNANLANLSNECRRLLVSGADYLHLDVMDGHFVPNITFGHSVVSCLRKDLGKDPFFDVHMMVAEPLRWIEPMSDAGCSQYTYHYESTSDNDQVIRKIREAGMKVGLGIKPGTSVEAIFPYIEKVDMVLVMTVEPGFGGQKFMSNMMPKIELLRSKFRDLDIEVDGGVGPATVEQCCTAGANMIVSGTAITQSSNPQEVMNEMRMAVESRS